ncbi:pentapeptide repeat-containing protein [Streptomyces sp. NPDC003333]
MRLTAQRLLDDRLRAPDGVAGDEAQHLPPSPDEPFWPGIDLDLTGAVLINFSLFNASVGVAMFHKTIFSGATAFNDTTFTSIAWFGDAVFAGPTGFYDSTFRYARFPKAIFGGNTRFTGATFRDQGVFVEAIFNGEARFDKATFSGEARFDMATFSREVSFYKATFSGDTSSAFSQARVLYLDDPGLKMRRFWPDGWTVRPNGDDPTRGTLIREEQADQPRGDGGGATP